MPVCRNIPPVTIIPDIHCDWNSEFCIEDFVLMHIKKNASSTFLIGKSLEVKFSGGAYDTRKSVSADIGAG